MKASDIPDVEFLSFLAQNGPLTFTWDLAERWPDYPWKVRLAKARQLLKRKLIAGCGCGCRGDFELTTAGRALLAKHEERCS